MVQKYGQFINEGKNNVYSLTYSVVTALAAMKPEYFDFLKSLKNRYFLTDNSFWQGLILEIKKTPEIKLDKQHLLNIKGISVEQDWNKIKKCFMAGQKIRETFPQIDSIRVLNDNGLVINGSELIRSKKEDDKLDSKDLESYLGFGGRKIYTNDLWKYLITHWVELMKNNLTDEYLKYYNWFLEKMEEDKAEMNWQMFKNYRVKGLGIRIDSLPKLYYNSFYDLNMAIATEEKCFKDFKLMVIDWLNFKNDILNKKILYPLIQQNKERLNAAKDLLVKFYSLGDTKYYRFDTQLNLQEIPSKQEFEVKEAEINIKEKFLINNRKDLIIEIKSDDISLKVMIAMKGLCPSIISIKSKYNEINDRFDKMGEL